MLLMQIAPLAMIEVKPLNGRFLRPIDEAPTCERNSGPGAAKTITSSSSGTQTKRKKK